MNRNYLLLLIFLFLVSCSQREHRGNNTGIPEATPLAESKQETSAPELKPGIEAKSQGMHFLMPKKINTKQEISEAWISKQYPKVEHLGTVLVIAIEDSFAKVRTFTQEEGWMPAQNLKPFAVADSARYYAKRKFGIISTVLGVYEMPYVTLWDDISSENKKEQAKCLKGDKVIILEETEQHVKVGTVNGYEGWCMKGFVKFLE